MLEFRWYFCAGVLPVAVLLARPLAAQPVVFDEVVFMQTMESAETVEQIADPRISDAQTFTWLTKNGDSVIEVLEHDAGRSLRLKQSSGHVSVAKADLAGAPLDIALLQFDFKYVGGESNINFAGVVAVGHADSVLDLKAPYEDPPNVFSAIDLRTSINGGRISFANVGNRDKRDGQSQFVDAGESVTVRIYYNNSGEAIEYLGPDGEAHSLANDAFALWFDETKQTNPGGAAGLGSITHVEVDGPEQDINYFTLRLARAGVEVELDNVGVYAVAMESDSP